MPLPLPLVGVVIAKNEGDRIERCVRSMAGLCMEVIVLDSGSSDDTVLRAGAAGATVVHQQWLGFSGQKNAAIAMAAQPWVLLLDADEWLGEGAEMRLRALFDSGGVEAADVWILERRTHYLGGTLNFGGWGRESVQRLFRPSLRYLPAKVHEKLDTKGCRMKSARIRIEHDTARSASEYRDKLMRYAELWADEKKQTGRRAGALSPWLHAGAYWLKNYLLRGGFLDGPTGWRYHSAHTRYVWRKYRFLRTLTRQQVTA